MRATAQHIVLTLANGGEVLCANTVFILSNGRVIEHETQNQIEFLNTLDDFGGTSGTGVTAEELDSMDLALANALQDEFGDDEDGLAELVELIEHQGQVTIGEPLPRSARRDAQFPKIALMCEGVVYGYGATVAEAVGCHAKEIMSVGTDVELSNMYALVCTPAAYALMEDYGADADVRQDGERMWVDGELDA